MDKQPALSTDISERVITRRYKYMADVSNYKCPACGGPLVFSGAKQTLHCASCGNDYDAETLKMMDNRR